MELKKIQDEVQIPKKKIKENKNEGNVIKNISSVVEKSTIKSIY